MDTWMRAYVGTHIHMRARAHTHTRSLMDVMFAHRDPRRAWIFNRGRDVLVQEEARRRQLLQSAPRR